MPVRRKVPLAILLACVGAGGFAAWHKPDHHRSAERQAWKDRAVAEINREAASPTDAGMTDDEWLSAGRIVCSDGSWLAFRSQCHKQDPKVHDIFVAKASDGRWYYSDFHFCIGAMVIGMRGQPESLAQFQRDYFLAEFDGNSDAALSPTWRPAK